MVATANILVVSYAGIVNGEWSMVNGEWANYEYPAFIELYLRFNIQGRLLNRLVRAPSAATNYTSIVNGEW